jgi:2-methylcitrate dehydratase PrpD
MTVHANLDPVALSIQIARSLRGVEPSTKALHVCWRLCVDVVGLAVAARESDYVKAVLGSCADDGPVTIFGHDRKLGLYDAALVNGTAAHGEDYDDTFEGGPVHAGAVVVPAVLALADMRSLDRDAVLRGIAVGAELMCRLSLVAPQAIHKAGFHPTAVIGALAAAGAASAALDLDEDRFSHALGTAGSLASGIIEYLADGSWTKRLHAGAAAQAGLRSALLAESGFVGPRTVLEGSHGFFKAFAPSRSPDFSPLLEGLGQRWVMEDIAFKPYACGTMTQPFVDCAIELAKQGITAEQIERLVCFVGEGTVHRLWEPLAGKRTPPNGYAAKFSTPFCVAVGFLDHAAGLEQFTNERAFDPGIRALAAKVSYEVDPDDEYPRNFTGRIRAELRNGRTMDIRKPHMRGGVKEPLTDAELVMKFHANLDFGKASESQRQVASRRLSALTSDGNVRL